ncbi:hypothetical protein TREES_T100004912 [Tupaia chinensis]|uniref:Uncharacterized protein n=1 Tax=Tupaia chinensis TaxID=246437 RepID=L9LDJ9_TUPCH|nr:hypothetical protein TREES_T100004912 [Tupaia chinensis]
MGRQQPTLELVLRGKRPNYRALQNEKRGEQNPWVCEEEREARGTRTEATEGPLLEGLLLGLLVSPALGTVALSAAHHGRRGGGVCHTGEKSGVQSFWPKDTYQRGGVLVRRKRKKERICQDPFCFKLLSRRGPAFFPRPGPCFQMRIHLTHSSAHAPGGVQLHADRNDRDEASQDPKTPLI